ncbi:GTP pyrophosphokinase/guanosine-3',5'-bis(diphosphate) 3'-pyrophosphohydrolase [Paucibacter oligotrophus]|uniref:GTP pyrophosphokinase/guanosine-3',5'-bis(Diphosphate) 3'-pyrophosphohydrolase n=1 Tax=Roseateles oligotrophus TaxID=1769250 RepID=A0A840L6D1_9BURK|nr:bifunctional (p)ppGpp synthetase/guanosine-3',5'-bis(diphosphate) 3'-pyrophosphohydrolase [Roseateles oligotrophus]MBB4843740.1 GTP pyrophosphokinase/guanosine-3',5'-bis(diphosphate) 3'-pyrophosphohydrolase [Roseateles oligotrophus]
MGFRSFAVSRLPAALSSLPGLRPAPAAPEPTAAEAASFDALVHRLSYLPKADIKRIREAYKFADEAHLGQFRASGEPYITHPIAVAGLCADWRLDAQAIMAALMHDAMEDCGVTKTELIERFGAPTAELVDGLTKLDKLQFSTKEESQAESFRKMLLAMARDVRVILIKLADRLHNMRTMEAMAPAKRRRIARETLDIYAPIAHRLGLNQIYRELQELSFSHIYPWRHAALSKAIAKARGNRRDLVSRIERDVEKAFAASDLRVEVQGREKTVYSIYQKMRDKHLSFAQVSDIFGFRIVVHDLPSCYLSLGVLHQLYKPQPGRFKDYIAIPKPNGYQSLHTTLVSPLGTPVEFQLRTESMHLVAEKGVAAHWLYKNEGSGGGGPESAQQMGSRWLQSLIDIQDETRDANEFLEHVKIDLFPDAVYVFTPKSKIMALPRGATPVDYAYAIHSDVGDHCVAAQINGEPVPLRTELRSGDVVEIVTAAGARPNPAWLSFVRTGRARSKIRHFLKNLEQDESRDLGEKMLSQALRAEGLALPSLDDEDNAAAQLWQQLARWAGNRHIDELLVEIGLGRKIATIVAKKLARMLAEQGQRPDAVMLTMGRFSTEEAPAQGQVTLDGSEGASVRLASCCRPIPGDEIKGYLGRGEGLLVHTAECQVGRKLFQRDSEHWIAVHWAEELSRPFEAAVALLLNNGKGVLAQVAQAVSAAEADITHIQMSDESQQRETAEMNLLLSVRDRLHLAEVLRTLKRSPAVLRVWRVKPT